MSTELFVAERFDTLQDRFKTFVAESDVRLTAIERATGPLAGKRILDLGCGKGRFARHWISAGATVVGLDISHAMLERGLSFPRVRGSVAHLPFADGQFDMVAAIEVLEHVEPSRLPQILAESYRVLAHGGSLAIVDKNATALDAQRPWLPATLVKRVDELRGRWMYRPGEPFREHWFIPSKMKRMLRQQFPEVRCSFLLRPEEQPRLVFHYVPRCRLWTLWHAHKPGASR